MVLDCKFVVPALAFLFFRVAWTCFLEAATRLAKEFFMSV